MMNVTDTAAHRSVTPTPVVEPLLNKACSRHQYETPTEFKLL